MGSPGTGRTDLYVRNKAIFAGQLEIRDANVSGVLTCSNPYRFNSSQGYLTGVAVTATSYLRVGDDPDKFVITGDQCGIGTASPRAKLDVDGAIKIKTSSENVHALDISSNNVDVDLSKGQSFT